MKRELNSVGTQGEKREVVIISRPFVSPQKRCERCAEPSGMITPDEAAAVCDVSTRTIYRWLESGEIHFREELDGSVHICLISLAGFSNLSARSFYKGEKPLKRVARNSGEILESA